MTVTHSLLDNLIEDQTYQLSTSPDGQGGTRWDLHRYQRPGPDLAELAGLDKDTDALWCPVKTWTTATPLNGHYRDGAMSRLRELGYEPTTMDLVLMLPDGYERLRP